MPEDWDKDEADLEAYKENMKKFDMYVEEDWEKAEKGDSDLFLEKK